MVMAESNNPVPNSQNGETKKIICPDLLAKQSHLLNDTLLDEMTDTEITKMAVDRLTGRFPKLTDDLKDKGGTSDPLLCSLARKNGEYLKIIRKKDEAIQKLETRIKSLELQLEVARIFPSTSESDSSQVRLLERCCEQLQKQIFEMEEFLHDYGLVWVGTQKPSQDELYRGDNSQKASYFINNPETLKRIISNIEFLNQWIGAGEAKITRDPTDPKKAYLKEQQPIPLTLYADGICLYNGPFRPFTQHETMQFVQDILDGFFPSELELIYPDGVPFKLIDKRHTEFLKGFHEQRKAHPLGGKGKTSCLVDKAETECIASGNAPEEKSSHKGDYLNSKSQENPSTAPDQSESDLLHQLGLYPCPRQDPLTFDDLLKRMPKYTIGKSGQIINIRDDLRSRFAPSSQSVPVKQIELLGSNEEDSRLSDVISLRIRSENGSCVYSIRMAKTDTVGQLYSCLNSVRDSTTPYRLIVPGPANGKELNEKASTDSSHPCCSYALTELDQTLEKANIKTRTLLHMEFSRDAKYSLCPTVATNKPMWNPTHSFVSNYTDL